MPADNPSGGGVARHLLRGMRPRQWIKNLLVVLAPAAAGEAFHLGIALRTGVAFIALCLAASGTYLLNDIRDVEADRLHPQKRSRPVASGSLPIGVAAVAAVVLLAAGIGIGAALEWRLGLVVALYVAETVSYSFGVKNIPVIELGFVAAGFVLRAIAGGVATNLPLSSWFLVVISFGALFVVVGKRLAEFHHLGEDAGSHRQVLTTYTETFLDSALVLCAGVTVTAYCLWALDADDNLNLVRHSQIWIELSVIPVVLGVLYVLLQLSAGRGGAPEDLVLKDRTVQSLGVALAICVAIGVYG